MTAPQKARQRPAATARAKAAFLQRIKQGHTIADALAAAGRSRSAYELWRKNDPEFLDAFMRARGQGRLERPAPGRIEFPEFCERYLDQPLHWHQLQWYDLLEGRKPRDLHPAEVYEPGDPNFIIVNTPPEHGKSATLSINYVTYRLCTQPNVRIMLISKTQERAKEFLYAVKTRLSHPRFETLQAAFAPPGGWRADSSVWSSDRIYLGSERDSGEKDPSVQAIGIGGQVYGARSDLIILDDGVVLANAHAYESQIRWLQQEVLTRLGPTGKLLVVGTRVDAQDLYRALMEPERYPSGQSPWTRLAQPAVLAYGETPDDWQTLWPRAKVPWAAGVRQGEDGLYPRWDGPHLARRRGTLHPRTWALAYQQAQVEEDATFDAMKVRACVNGMRTPGLMNRNQPNVRQAGMDGLYVIGSMDPAMVGDTGVVVMGVDRHERMRYVLDCKLKTSASPAWIRATIKELTELYSINEWRIEGNAFQSFLSQDPELTLWLGNLGIRIAEHTTSRNKWDPSFGVASMAVLFELKLIELPSTYQHEAGKQLVEQLVTWSPETKAKTDLVMALWFAEIRAREICQAGTVGADDNSHGFQHNRFLSRRRRSQQTTINLNDLAATRR